MSCAGSRKSSQSRIAGRPCARRRSCPARRPRARDRRPGARPPDRRVWRSDDAQRPVADIRLDGRARGDERLHVVAALERDVRASIIAPCECPNAWTTSPGSAPASSRAASVASYDADRSPTSSSSVRLACRTARSRSAVSSACRATYTANCRDPSGIVYRSTRMRAYRRCGIRAAASTSETGAPVDRGRHRRHDHLFASPRRTSRRRDACLLRSRRSPAAPTRRTALRASAKPGTAEPPQRLRGIAARARPASPTSARTSPRPPADRVGWLADGRGDPTSSRATAASIAGRLAAARSDPSSTIS